MSKEYIAVYTETKGSSYKRMKDVYKSKEEFRKDIIANGYHCVVILTEEKVKEIKNDECALSNNINLSERLIAYIKECM